MLRGMRLSLMAAVASVLLGCPSYMDRNKDSKDSKDASAATADASADYVDGGHDTDPDGSVADGGNLADAAGGSDAGDPADAAVVADAGPAWDAGAPPDAAVSPDAGGAAPAPRLDSVDPSQGPPGGGILVHVQGAHFQPAARVAFGEQEASFIHFVDPGTLDVLVPPGEAGTVAVTVTNLDGQSASQPAAFTYQAARVLSLDAVQADGVFGPDADLDIRVHWNQPVVVTGAPTLALATGTVAGVAEYLAGSGTDTLRFHYVVKNGDNSTDLEVASPAALTTPDGAIRDLGGGAVVLDLPVGSTESLGGRRALVLDTTPPTWGGTLALADSVTHDPSSSPALTWTANATDDNSGVARYQVAVGTGAAGPALRDVRDWTAVDASPVQVQGLQLSGSETYTVSMRALDQAGNASAVIVGPSFTYGAELHLVVASAPQLVEAGACSGAVTVELQDAVGTPVQSRGNTLLRLSAAVAAGGQGNADAVRFFADPACSWWVSGTGMAPGETQATFYVLAQRNGQYAFTVEAGAMTASQELHVLPRPAALEFTQPAFSVTAAACTPEPMLLRALDETGTPLELAAARAILLTATGTRPPTFFLDAACQTPAVEVSLPAGTAEFPLYAWGHAQGDFTLVASSTGVTSAQAGMHVSPGVPTRLLVSPAAQDVVAGKCSQVVDVQVADAEGNSAAATTAITVTPAAADNDTVRFFSDPTCLATAPTVDIAVGRTSGTLYFKGTRAGRATVQLDAPSFTSTPQQHSIIPGEPSQFLFVSDFPFTTAGECSQPMDLVQTDAYGNESSLDMEVRAELFSVSPWGDWRPVFTDAACSNQLSELVFAPGQNHRTLYWTGELAGATTLVARWGTGLPNPPYYIQLNGSAQVQVRSAVPARLVLNSEPLQVPINTCSPTIGLQFQDRFQNAASFPVDTAVTLGVAGFTDVVISAGPQCTGSVTAVTVPANQSGTVFSFKGSALGARPIHLASGSMTADLEVTVVAPPPAKLQVIQVPSRGTAGVCAGPFRVQRQDGNSAPVVTGTSFINSEVWDPWGWWIGTFSDSACQTQTNTLAITPGFSTVDFYIMPARAGGYGLQFYEYSEYSLYAGASLQVDPGAPARLQFETGSQNLVAGHCSSGPTRVRVLDGWDNPTTTTTPLPVLLSSDDPAGFRFYSDSTCTTAVTSVNVPANTGSVDVYVKGKSAPSTKITAALQSPAFNVTQVENVAPDRPTVLAFTTGLQTLTSGVCSELTTVQSGDEWGNRSAVAADLLVSLGVKPAVPPSAITVRFYEDQDCTAEIPTVVINGGLTTASFYFKPVGPAGTVEIQATATSFTAGTQVVTVR